MPGWSWWGWDFFVVLVSWLGSCFFWWVLVYVCLVLGFVSLPLVKKLSTMQDKLEFESFSFFLSVPFLVTLPVA